MPIGEVSTSLLTTSQYFVPPASLTPDADSNTSADARSASNESGPLNTPSTSAIPGTPPGMPETSGLFDQTATSLID